MDEIDRMLARLADAGPPAALDGLDDRVLARLRTARGGGRPLAIVVLFAVALGIGVVGSVPAPTEARAMPALLGGVSPLAPSTLLSGE